MKAQNANRKGSPIEVKMLRLAMLNRDLSVGKLAQMARVGARRVTNVLSGSDTTWPIRAAINRALRESIFTKPARKR